WGLVGKHRYWRLVLTNTPGSGAWIRELSIDPSRYIPALANGRIANGRHRRIFASTLGDTVKTILGYGAAEATITQLGFDVLHHRLSAIDPRLLNTTYTVNTRGQQIAKTSPDAGTINRKYDRGGNLRYSQDANQSAVGQVFFTTYDFANRP